MRKEKDFKKIMEAMADDIAGASATDKGTADGSRVNAVLDSTARLEIPLRAIDITSEAKEIVLHLLSMMEKLSYANKRSALTQAIAQLPKEDSSSAPKTSSSAPTSDLKEVFNRINRRY